MYIFNFVNGLYVRNFLFGNIWLFAIIYFAPLPTICSKLFTMMWNPGLNSDGTIGEYLVRQGKSLMENGMDLGLYSEETYNENYGMFSWSQIITSLT